MVQRQERGRRIARTSAQPRSHGDPLPHMNGRSQPGIPRRGPKTLRGADHEVGFSGRHIRPIARQPKAPILFREFQRVVQVDGLKDREEIVIAVGAAPDYPEPEVDLGGRQSP